MSRNSNVGTAHPLEWVQGKCEMWAADFINRRGGNAVWIDELPGHENLRDFIDHQVVKLGNKYYDALNPDGASDWRKLNFVRWTLDGTIAARCELLRASQASNPRVSLRAMPHLSPAAKRQLARGARVEMEHTRDREAARLIAAQHLAESPRYYSALARMEKGLKRNPTHVVDFKLAAAMRRLRLAISCDSGRQPSEDQVEAMVEQSFRFLKHSIEKRESRILSHRDWADVRLAAVTELIRLVESGALRRNNPGAIRALPTASARGMKVLKGFRPVLQTRDWTCGPACARAILASRNVNADEADLARRAGTTKAHGTTPTQMCDLIHDSGYRIVPTKRATLAWCLRQLRQSRPVLLLWNDWKGHWVVLIGYDAHRPLLLLADPAAAKGVSVHTYRTFTANWRTKVAGQVYRRLAVAIA